LTQISLQYL